MTARTDRLDELLQQEIGAILSREISDPRVGFATVTDVETTPDLRHARVWVSVIGQPDEREETRRALQRAMSYVRRELGLRLRLKRIPELHVRLDETAERGTRVLRLLSELEAGHDAHEPLQSESLPTPRARPPREGDAPEPTDQPAPGPRPARRPQRGATLQPKERRGRR
jgi:ribosome-binding factor A